RHRLEDGLQQSVRRVILRAVRPLPPDEPAVRRAPNPTTVRLELTCLLCGELAGVFENGRVVRPGMPGSVGFDWPRLPCGRCGGILSLGFDELRWPRPVRPEDELRVESEVLEVRPSKSRPEHGLVKVRTTTLNQNGEAVQVATANLLVLRRPT